MGKNESLIKLQDSYEDAAKVPRKSALDSSRESSIESRTQSDFEEEGKGKAQKVMQDPKKKHRTSKHTSRLHDGNARSAANLGSRARRNEDHDVKSQGKFNLRSSTCVESTKAGKEYQNSKSQANLGHKQKIQVQRVKQSAKVSHFDKESSFKDHHKVNCAAWGCTCQNKGKPKVKESRNRIPTAPVNTLPPRHPNINRIQTMFPKLYRWDQQQIMRLKRGEISKEEYVRERNANFADVLDDEDEINGRRRRQQQQQEQ